MGLAAERELVNEHTYNKPPHKANRAGAKQKHRCVTVKIGQPTGLEGAAMIRWDELKKAPRIRQGKRKSIEWDELKKMPGKAASAAGSTASTTLVIAPQNVVQLANKSGLSGINSPTTLSHRQLSPEFLNLGAAENYLQSGSFAEFSTPEKASENQRAKTQLNNLRNNLNASTQFQNDEEELALRAARDPKSVMKDISAVLDASNAYETGVLNELATRTYEDKFTGQFSANKTLGRLTQDENMAWNNYMISSTPENLGKAEATSAAKEKFIKNNKSTIANDASLPLISQSLARYIPQLTDQLGAQIAGGVAGGVIGSAMPAVGTAVGIKAGAIAASGVYSYNNMRGAAFKNLLGLGVDEETARKAASDEALISALIEMADTGIDIATLGIGNVISLVAKGGARTLAKKGATEVAETAGKKLFKILAKYGINVGSEAAQEGAQESVTIANERGAQPGETGKLNLVGNAFKVAKGAITGNDPQAAQRISQASAEGAKIAALVGGAQTVGSNIGVNAMNRKAANLVPSSPVSGRLQTPAAKTKAAANTAAYSPTEAATGEQQVIDGIKQLGQNGMKAILAVADEKGNLSGYVQGFAAYYRVGLEGKDLSQAKTAHEFRLSDVQRLGAYFSGQNDAALAKATAAAPNLGSSSTVPGVNTPPPAFQKMQLGAPAASSPQTANGYVPKAADFALKGAPASLGAEANSLSKNPLADSQNMDYDVSVDDLLQQLAYEMVSGDPSARNRTDHDYAAGNESPIYALNQPITKGAGELGKIADGGNITRFTYKHNPSNNPKVLADAVEDPKAIYGYRPNKEGSLKAFADGDWSNPDFVEGLRQDRISYHNRNEVGVLELISKMRNQGYTDDQVVRAVVEYRNQSRLSSYLDAKGNVIDQEGYAQALAHCKTYEQLRAEGKTNESIIKSATRGNPGMDASTGLYDDYYDQYTGEK